MLVVLVRTNVIEIQTSKMSSGIVVLGSLSDIVKGVVCAFAGVGWVALAKGVLPQTPVGLVILLVPFGVLVLVGAFFFVRGYIKNLQ